MARRVSFRSGTNSSVQALMAFLAPLRPIESRAMGAVEAASKKRQRNSRRERGMVALAGYSLIGGALIGVSPAAAQTPSLVTGTTTTASGTIDGNNAAGYFIHGGGALTINNATVQNFTTIGGTGSGGGAGFGGAIFVGSGGSAVLNGVNFSHNTAVGGNAIAGAVSGGTLNNGVANGYLSATASGALGVSGIMVPDNATQFGDGKGNGIPGVFVGNGGNATNGFGGAGGIGGAGTNGWSSNPVAQSNLSIANDAVATATMVRDAGIAQLVVHSVFAAAEIIGTPLIGADPLSGAGDKFAYGMTIARGLGDIAFSAVSYVGSEQTLAQAQRTQTLAQDALDAWYIAAGLKAPASGPQLTQSLVGNGGNGQNGGNGGNGTFGFGGGAGGQGGAYGLGGTIILSGQTANTTDGTGGSGGAGGAGGFGAGGGSGGYGFGAGQNGGTRGSTSGTGGAGGAGGFGGGAGSTGGVTGESGSTGGGGGQGYGGAIFVNSGGSLTLTGNATFTGNNAVGGGSLNGGTAGTGAGSDLFLMTGSTTKIAPGAGNTITFNGSIADDSITSIGASNAVGSGASVQIYAGTTIFNGQNTYSGQTVIRGGALSGTPNTATNTTGAPSYATTAGGLRAVDGVGLPTNSNLNFAGSNLVTGGVLEANGVFNRWVGTNANRVQWTGSGGFAAVDGPLTVTLNQSTPGVGTSLTWGAGSFVPYGGSLMFGSTNSTDKVTFTNSINISGGYASIVVADNGNTAGSNATLSGILSGTGGLFVNGGGYNGTLNLSGANTYAGATLVNSGTLALTGAGSIANSANLIANGKFDISATTSGAAVTTLSGAGTIALGSKTLAVTNASTYFTGAITDGGIGGGIAGTLIVAAGTQTLTGTNTYTGGTTIANGATLALSGIGSIATSSGVTAVGALDISQTTAGASIVTLAGSGTVALGAQALTLTAASTTFAGSIGNGGIGGGVGGILNVTGGTQSLAGTNTYTGSTSISGGATLALLGTGSISTSSVVHSNGTLDISQTSSGASIRTLTGSGNVALGARALNITAGSTIFSGVIGDGGIGGGTGGQLNVTGGQQALSNVNTFTGGTTIDAGAKLFLTGAGAIASSSVVTANGTFDISTASSTANIKTLAGNGTVELGNGQLAITAGSTTFGGVIQGAGSLVVSGGTQTLAGVNSYTGFTLINSGATLSLNGAGSIATSSGVDSNGTFDISGVALGGTSIRTLGGSGSVVLGANTLGLTQASGQFSGVVSGTGGLTVLAGTETLTGANTFTGETNVMSGAALNLTGTGSIAASSKVNIYGTIDISNTTSGTSFTTLAGDGTVGLGGKPLTITAGSTTFAGSIQGSGALTIAGGTQSLSGANTYTGLTTINSGATLAMSGFGTIATSSGVANAGTLDMRTSGNGRIQTLSGNGSVLLGGQALDITAGTAGVSGTQSTGTFSGTISGNGGVIVSGGTQALTGANTYTGATLVSNATLAINSGAALGAASNQLILNNGTLLALGNVTTGQSITVTGANAVNSSGNTVNLTGTISGAGSLSLTGGGTFGLTGTNTYTGGTVVSYNTNVNATSTAVFGAGPITLLGAGGTPVTNMFTGQVSINGPLSLQNSSTPLLIIAAGDTISGNGVINVKTEVRGQLSPGNSPGTLTFAAPVALTAGSSTRMEIDGATSSVGGGGAGTYDTTQVIGAGNTFTAGGTLNPVLRGITGAANNTYTPAVTTTFNFVQAAGGVLGSFAGINQPSAGLAPGTRLDALYFTNSINLYVTPSDYKNLSAWSTGLNTNQAQVAGAINALRGAAGPVNNAAASRDLALLYAQQPQSLPRVFSTLSGEVSTGAKAAGFRLMNHYLGLTSDPGTLNQGSVSNASTGLMPGMMSLGAGLSGPGRDAGNTSQPANNSRWSGWGAAFGVTENRAGTASAGSHDLSTGVYGLATGAAYRLGDSTQVGFSIAAANSKWSVAEGLGSGQGDSYLASFYGKTHFGQAYLAASAAVGTHALTTTRLAFSGDRLIGKVDAQSYAGRVEVGYAMRSSLLSVVPYAAFQTQAFNTAAYTETGSGFGLAFDAEKASTNRSEIGARIEIKTTLGDNMPLYLRARAAWVHDWSSTPLKTAAFAAALQPGAIAGAGTTFSIDGVSIVQDAALVSASAELALTPYVSIGASLDGGEFSRGAQTYGGSGSVRIQW